MAIIAFLLSIFLADAFSVNNKPVAPKALPPRDVKEIALLKKVVQGFLEGHGSLDVNKMTEEFSEKFQKRLEELDDEPALDYYYLCKIASDLYRKRCVSKPEDDLPARLYKVLKESVVDMTEWKASEYEQDIGHAYWRDLDIKVLSAQPLIVQTDIVLPITLTGSIMRHVSKLEPLPHQHFKDGQLPPLAVTDGYKIHSHVKEPHKRIQELASLVELDESAREAYLKEQLQIMYGNGADSVESASLVEMKARNLTRRLKNGVSKMLYSLSKARGVDIETIDAKEDSIFKAFEMDIQNFTDIHFDQIVEEARLGSCDHYADVYTEFCGAAQYTTSCPLDSRTTDILNKKMKVVMGHSERQITTPQFMRLSEGDFAADEVRNPAVRPYAVGLYMFMSSHVEEGGELVFPLANVRVKPQRGRAIIFFPGDSDRQHDKRLAHYFTSVKEGDIWVLRQYASTHLKDRAVNAEHNNCVDKHTVEILMEAAKEHFEHEKRPFEEAVHNQKPSMKSGSTEAERALENFLDHKRPVDFLVDVPVYKRLINERHILQQGSNLDDPEFIRKKEHEKDMPATTAVVNDGDGFHIEAQTASKVSLKQASNIVDKDLSAGQKLATLGAR